MKGFKLEDCILKECRFDNANIDKSQVIRTTFLNCTFTAMKDENTWDGVTMTGGSMEGADLSGANIEGLDLKGVNVTNLDLSKAKVADVNFANCKGVDTVNTEGAELINCDFEAGDKPEFDDKEEKEAAEKPEKESKSKKSRAWGTRYLTENEKRGINTFSARQYNMSVGLHSASYDHPYAHGDKSSTMEVDSLKARSITASGGAKTTLPVSTSKPRGGRTSARGKKYSPESGKRGGFGRGKGKARGGTSRGKTAVKSKSQKAKASTYPYNDVKHLSATSKGHFVEKGGRGGANRSRGAVKRKVAGKNFDHLLDKAEESAPKLSKYGLTMDLEKQLQALGI